MGVRRTWMACGAAALLIAAVTACTPDPGPTTPPTTLTPTTLPVAPRMNVPASMPPGTAFLVEHSVRMLHPSPSPSSLPFQTLSTEYLRVDADSIEPHPTAWTVGERLDMLGRVAPDGRALVTSSERPDLFPAESSVLECLTPTSSDCRPTPLGSLSSSYSPDGSKVATWWWRGDFWEAVPAVAIFDARTFELLTEADVADFLIHFLLPAAWSPTSDAVAITTLDEPTDRDGSRSLAVLPAAEGATPVTIEAGTPDGWPMDAYGWSDDGWITFGWTNGDYSGGLKRSVLSIRADGTGEPELLSDGSPSGLVQALPDGSAIATLSAPADEVPHLMRRGQPPVPLAQPARGTNGSDPTWTHTSIWSYVPRSGS